MYGTYKSIFVKYERQYKLVLYIKRNLSMGNYFDFWQFEVAI